MGSSGRSIDVSRRVGRLRQGLLLSQPRIAARHAEWSVISSVDDLIPPATDDLVGFALQVAERARSFDLTVLARRAPDITDARALQTWPGEHYQLLAALARELKPALVIEVGTFTGMGTLALLEGLGSEGRVVTYDVVPWRQFPSTLLEDSDFGDRLEQRLVDLQDERVFVQELPTLQEAGLIFIDGPKDGRFEPKLVSLLLAQPWGRSSVLVFDDIRLMAMIRLWRELQLPRLDLTSFGHWSGTGLCLLS